LPESAFEQIRLYAQADMAVSLRLLRALMELGRKILSGCAGRLGEEELKQMRVRLAALEGVATGEVSFATGISVDKTNH